MCFPCPLPGARASAAACASPLGLAPLRHPPGNPEVPALKQPALIVAIVALGACSSSYDGPKMPKGTALPPPEESVDTSAAPDISVQTIKSMEIGRASCREEVCRDL